MMLYLHSMLAFLLLLWLVYALHKDSFQVAYLLKQTIVWTASMLLLAALLSMLVKKPASASEQEVSAHLEVPFEMEMPTILESSLSTRCSNPQLVAVLKAALETEPLHFITLFGIWRSKTCSCLKTIKAQRITESDIWITVCNSQNYSTKD